MFEVVGGRRYNATGTGSTMMLTDQRNETREGIIGDVLWADASAAQKNEGLLLEQSKSGINILTKMRVKKGSILRICCKGSWMGDQYVTVQWCHETEPGVFRCGLPKIKHC